MTDLTGGLESGNTPMGSGVHRDFENRRTSWGTRAVACGLMDFRPWRVRWKLGRHDAHWRTDW